MAPLALDHLVVAAARLEEGVAAVEAALGVTLDAGGAHALMGTHNRLLSLGDLYLEVIAPDPAAARPGRPRWFDLDNPPCIPRLSAWVLRTSNVEEVQADLPEAGPAIALARGDLSWRITVPADGRLPLDGLFPALIAWDGSAHPLGRLPDRGCRLAGLVLSHPDAPALAARLAPRLADARLGFVRGPPGLSASIATPGGRRWLG